MPKVIQLVWNYESFPRMFSEQQLLCFADKSPHMMSTSFFFVSSEIMQRNVGCPRICNNTWTCRRCTHILCSVTPKRPINEKASSTDKGPRNPSLQPPQALPYHRFYSVLFTQVEQCQLSSTPFPNSPFLFCCCRSNSFPEMTILQVLIHRYWLYSGENISFPSSLAW